MGLRTLIGNLMILSCLIFGIMTVTYAQNEYLPGPNSQRYDRIPEGKVNKYSWESKIYPNTIREYYLYIPAQYDASLPAALMIFQDGHAYVKEDGNFKVPIVFDNLISQDKMPVTIGLFINPGHDRHADSPENPFRVTNRSIEYDEVSDTYARYLIEELIPEVKKSYNISDDPKMRAICGLSSGAICSFTAAWHMPEQFHKVLSHIGSFTDIRGGHNYPPMIRKNDKKDIKVFLQDGDQDLNNQFGDWWLANQQMASALKFKDYDYQFVPGTGGHDGKHGGAILPESLTWLWKEEVPSRISEGVYTSSNDGDHTVLMNGETKHFSEMAFEIKKHPHGKASTDLFQKDLEQILIIKEGKVALTLNQKSETIGPNSVAILMAGDQGSIKSDSPESTYYTMNYKSKKIPVLKQEDEADESFLVNFDKLEFKSHSRGGRRNYFNRSTAMCSYYEMHVTTLNPGIKSHEPHVHQAAEIILMIDGHTEMEIGNAIYKASKGDVYFLPSNVPHAIKNIGNEQCMYFAFQWH